jgi:hypothetical protein
MKYTVLTIMSFVTTAALAQTTTTGGPAGAQSVQSFSAAGPARNIEDLAGLLGLDEGQKAQVKAALDQQQAQLEEFAKEVRASGQDAPFEQVQATMTRLQKATHERLSGILTDAQLEKFDALEQAYRLSASPSAASGLMLQPASAGCDASGRCRSR